MHCYRAISKCAYGLALCASFAIVLTAASQTPRATEPPGHPGTIVFVDGVGVSIRQGSFPLPQGCDPAAVVHLINAFLDAFNRNDQNALPRFFPAEANPAEPAMFHWFAVNGPPGGFNPGFSAENRSEVLPYVTARHAHGERMRLLQIDYGSDKQWARGTRGIGFTLDVLRSADDIPTHQAGVKGGIDCRAQTITTWGMADGGIVPDAWFATPIASPTS